MANTENLDFIILSETHLTKEIEESEIMLNGYEHGVSLSNSQRTGGVIIYVRRMWKITKLLERFDNTKYWVLVCKIEYYDIHIIIAAVYRSPSSSEAEFCSIFDEIEEICENNCDIIISGDFNIDWAHNGIYKNKIESTINDNGMNQIVNEYTRITYRSKTIIDYVITNSNKVSVEVNSSQNIADHEKIYINMELKDSTPKEKKVETREIFKYKKDLFNRHLSAIMAHTDSVDVNENTIMLDKGLEETIRYFTEKRTISQKNNVKKWFNSELRVLKNEKNKKLQIARFKNTIEAWTNYKECRNIYKVKIENEKNKFVNNKINNAKDQRQMWSEIKRLVLKKKQNMIENVIFDQKEYSDNKMVADKFNQYFVNSIKYITDSIDKVQYKNNIQTVTQKFKFRAISLLELKKVVIKMNKKPDYNNVSNKIIKDNWNITGKILLKIINKSLESGIFPENWKETMVTPIGKVDNTKKCEEFRPINTLKACEKIVEKVLKNQLEKYMEENFLISKYQSGFRNKYSCETAVNYVINRWKQIPKDQKIMAIFLDFKRAFETIDRKIMLEKLFMYGIQDNELNWFRSYLNNRKQVTKINGIKSYTIKNNFGVPQGSILGALLFIIYINDMPNVITRSEIVLYADDTLIYSIGENEEQCQNNMTHDINSIDNWLKMNKLKLNEQKTKIIEINMNNNTLFKINGEIIEKVKQIKYLGFIIDKELKIKNHVEYICKKIGKKNWELGTK